MAAVGHSTLVRDRKGRDRSAPLRLLGRLRSPDTAPAQPQRGFPRRFPVYDHGLWARRRRGRAGSGGDASVPLAARRAPLLPSPERIPRLSAAPRHAGPAARAGPPLSPLLHPRSLRPREMEENTKASGKSSEPSCLSHALPARGAASRRGSCSLRREIAELWEEYLG